MAFTIAELHELGLELPANYKSHRWTYNHALRNCLDCGASEAAWDDMNYPVDPCPATDLRDGERENEVRQWMLDAYEQHLEYLEYLDDRGF